MYWQLGACATQARKASWLECEELDELDELEKPDELDELDELDDELSDPHISIRAWRQLPLCREVEEKAEPENGKQVPHLAMMLSTAFSQLDFSGGQPVRPRTEKTAKAEKTNPRNDRLMSIPPSKRVVSASIGSPAASDPLVTTTNFRDGRQ